MNKLFVIALAATLMLSAKPAFAFDGVAASSGAARDEASACQEAKRNGDLAVGAALQLQGISARHRIVGFGTCMCSRDPQADRNPAWEAFAYNCTVDVQYEILYDQ